MSLPISFIVAVAKNGVIGQNGAMPWHLSTDLKRFKTLTLNQPIIMGRKTFASIGRPLPNRQNIIISRNLHLKIDGATVCNSLESALNYANETGAKNAAGTIFIIGGGEIFDKALPLAKKIYVTEILADIVGDTFFPRFDASQWKIIHQENFPQGEKDSHETRFVIYERSQ